MNEVRTRSRLKSSGAARARGNGRLHKSDGVAVWTEESPAAQTRQILAAMEAFRDGDFSVRLPTQWSNTNARLAAAFNQTMAQQQRMSEEVARLTESVGKQGRLRQRISLPGGVGGWAAAADALNTLIDDLVRPTTEIARALGAVAKGDLAESMDLQVDGRALKGELLRSAKLVNTMIQQLAVFTSEVTRVAREVATEGKLSGQAQVKGVSGEPVLEGDSSGAVDGLHKPINATVARSRVGIFANLYRQARDLERINRKLGQEVAERREAQRGLQKLNRTLEQRVKARTKDLVERTRVLEDAQGQLRAGAAQFLGLSDAAPGFIWSTDAQGHFTFMSRRFEVFTGQSLDQLRSGGWQQVLHPDDCETSSQQFLDAIRNHSPLSGRMRLRRADGVYRWIESSAVPLLDPQAEPSASFRGLIGVSMDNSDLASAEQALREADQRKDQFLATLAHELRNPLAPIRNAVHILRNQDSADAAARELHDIIDRQIGQMARMVDDLLDVSRISRGKLQLRKERVTLQQIIQGAVETSRPLIDQSHHQLEVVLPGKPLMLDADLTRLSQVFANLLNNAAKFTEASGRIKLVADERGAEVLVSVTDSGAGIPAQQMAKLFDLFSQGEGERRRSRGGLGIGLSLVKQLVELHHGRVTANSGGPGQGSEFAVRLPLAREQSAPAAAHAVHTGKRSAATRLRVLVVDDSEDAALTLATLLELAGYELHVAHDGEQALAVAEASRPDVVLLDIGLPKLSGNDVCRRFRQQDWGRQMTVIALTGWGQEQDRRRTTESGFDHHLVKPADPVALLKLLDGINA